MRGGLFLFPLYVDPADAAAADAHETLHPVAPEPMTSAESFNPQRLATLIRSADTGRLSSAGDATEIDAEVMNALPKWAQAVVQTGCFNGGAGSGEKRTRAGKFKRSLELQKEGNCGRPRKKRSLSRDEELQNGLDELNAELANVEMEDEEEMDDEEELPTFSTRAEITADSVDKYAELLETWVDVATTRQNLDKFDEDEMDVFQSEEVKMLLQSLKTMEKNDWIKLLELELVVSLMNTFDAQVRLGLAVNVLHNLEPNDGEGKLQPLKIYNHQVSRLEASLDIAICELIVMTTPHIDRKVLAEERIEKCFELLQHIIRRLLLPCIDTTYVTTASTPVTIENNRQHSTGGKPSSSKRVNLRANKRIRKSIERVSHMTCELMDQIAALILSVKLADRWILPLSSSMVELFALEHSSYATSLQQSALGILRAVFVQYEHHRDLILGDIVEIMVKLPIAKRTLRTVKLLNSSDTVQRISTLVVSIIQSCAATDKLGMVEDEDGPVPDSIEPSSTPDTVPEEKSLDNDIAVTTLGDIRRSAEVFVPTLLKACWKKTEERDNRVVLDNFVEDLLVMFVRPEWAGAEVLLEVLSNSLASILHANISPDVKTPDSQRSLAALNLVGKICASIKRYQRKDQNAMEDDTDATAVVEEHTSSLRVDITGKKARSRRAPPSSRIDAFQDVALKHVVVVHLQRHHVGQSDSKKLLILKFFLEAKAHWSGAEVACLERERELWKSLWKSRGGTKWSFKVAVPTSEIALKSSLHLAMKREFCGRFDGLLQHIMALLSKGLPTLRARVMKCLRGIVDVDPMLMAETGVQPAVEMCCSDEKPSVREAAVDLIGTYVLLQPLLFDKYFNILAERVRDKGIQVRKSVCKIFKIALVSMQDHSRGTITDQELRRKSGCMRCLVERIGDAAEEQGVKNFITDTFQEVWFGAELSSSKLSNPLSEFGDGSTLPPGWTAIANNVDRKTDAGSNSNGGGTKFVSNDGSVANSVEEAWSSYRTPTVTPASVAKNIDAKLDNSFEVVTTIVEVIRGVPNLDWFAKLLKRLLVDRGSGTRKMAARSTKDRSAQVAIAEDRSEKIIDRLVCCLMDLQEGKLLHGVSTDDGHEQFVACMTALAAFCEAKPQLLARHLDTIRVYLKEEDVKVQNLSVSMINNILSIKRVPQTVAGRLEDDLKFLVHRSPPSVVGPSIKCLATLSNTRNTPPVLLLRLLEHFFLSLRGYSQRESLDKLSEKDNYVLQRALFAAGKIVGSTDMDTCQQLTNEAKVLTIGTVTESLYELYKHFIRVPGNDACSSKAVQGMGFLFPIRPRLFLRAQQDGLLSVLLASRVGKSTLQCLVSMKELLLSEEKRMENGVAARTMDQSKSKEQQVQGDQEADASLIGNVMQVELGNILALSLHKVPQMRKEAITCISALLTQGLVNPLQCIPTLVVLETDHVPDVRDAAFSQLLTLYERFRTQFHTPLIKGIQNSYSFQLRVYGNATALGVDENEKEFCLFGRLYTSCLKPAKSHESLLLKALVNQFTDQGSVLKPFTNDETFTNKLKYLCYLAQIMSTLPYDVEDEPLYIIYLINRYVSLRLGPVLDDLKEAFASAGIAPELLEEEESDLQQVNINEYHPYGTLAGSKLVALQKNGRLAFSIALMLRLKFALKRNYQLDNEKCATYKPSATDVSMEARERSPKKLLLPSVDDLCQPDDPIEQNWNLFMVAWHAARKDQKQLDTDMEKELKPKPKTSPKRRRRSRTVRRKTSENDSNDEDEYVEGFASPKQRRRFRRQSVTVRQKTSENTDDEDEYVEGFA